MASIAASPCSQLTRTCRQLASTTRWSLANEKALGHFQGPIVKPQPNIHINWFGVIPKGHTPGKWRLITDLSIHYERSVNNGINPALCSLSYVSVDTVAAAAAAFGPGALMVKVDIESAYRLILVHPDDHCLLGVEWEDLRHQITIQPEISTKNIQRSRRQLGVVYPSVGCAVHFPLSRRLHCSRSARFEPV